ncbi:MAG: glycosyltransferase 61 family protein [Myxococcota bacterium]
MSFVGYAARRLLSKSASLEQVATDIETISDDERIERPEAKMLPGMLERALDSDPFTSLTAQLSVARGGSWHNRGTKAYHLSNAEIIPNGFFCRGHRARLKDESTLRNFWDHRALPRVDIEEGALISTYTGLRWFGDWLFMDNGQALLAEAMGAPSLALPPSDDWPHAPQYEHILNLPRRTVTKARVGHLIVFDDLGQNIDRRRRTHEMRRRARSAVDGQSTGHAVFMLRRRQGVDRKMVNEEELADWASKRGFVVIDPMGMTVTQMLNALRDARLVVGIEGSGMLHALLAMDTKGAFVSIVSPHRFVVSSKDYADALGIPYALMVGAPESDGHFRASLDELARTIEMVEGLHAA